MNNSLPPPVDEPLYQQIQRLKDLAIKTERPRMLTLEQRLLEWIMSLTPSQLERPLTISEVVKLANLVGRHRSQPALQEVAQLLRKYGFEAKRSWLPSSCNRRYWKFKG